MQGERPKAIDNHKLGEFALDGIPAAPRGVPQIEVTFDIDANGIVHVSAKDLGTGKENKVTITNSTNLSKDDIERMIQEAKANEEEDKKFKELVEVRNQADVLIATTERTIKDNGDKIPEDVKTSLEEALEGLKAVKDSDVKETIEAEIEKVSAIAHKLAEDLYKENEEQGETAEKPKDDVEEAEIVD